MLQPRLSRPWLRRYQEAVMTLSPFRDFEFLFGLKITKNRRDRSSRDFFVIRHLGKLCESRHHRSFWDANCRSFVFFKPFQAIEAPIFFCIPIFRHFQAIMPASRGEGGVWATRGLCVGSRAPARQKMIHLLSAEDISCTALF